ncbi:hypothetical protein ABTZ59_36455 [Streptomyces sp. NPDC094034]|uniref:hypothetical protein n=1 Tax=Streptomyces sp. NPDC094034 TaxID=3155309 RepID=UPI0033233A75
MADHYADRQRAHCRAATADGTLPHLTTRLFRSADQPRGVLSPEVWGCIEPAVGQGATTRADRNAFALSGFSSPDEL